MIFFNIRDMLQLLLLLYYYYYYNNNDIIIAVLLPGLECNFDQQMIFFSNLRNDFGRKKIY